MLEQCNKSCFQCRSTCEDRETDKYANTMYTINKYLSLFNLDAKNGVVDFVKRMFIQTLKNAFTVEQRVLKKA